VTALVPVYCPLCRALLCKSQAPDRSRLFFGCEHCEILFKVVIHRHGLSTFVRVLNEMPEVE
jgi:hypothetical protein